MTLYQESIMRVTGCNKYEAPMLENYMRNTVLHGACLDGLTNSQFNRAARIAHSDMKWFRTDDGKKWLSSEGLSFESMFI